MERYFIADSADVIGQVNLADDVSIWFQTVLRGDSNQIIVGKGTNIQDGTVVHVDHDAPVRLGEFITIGHQCLIHGCTVEDGALIGMGSILMNHCVIGKNSLVAAGSLVTENKIFPENCLIMGRPAKIVRQLTMEEIKKNQANTQHYIELSKQYLAGEFSSF